MRQLDASDYGQAGGWRSRASCAAIPGERRDWISCPKTCLKGRTGFCPGATAAGAASRRRRGPSCTVIVECAAMPRDGAIIFSDLIGKLDVLRVACAKCERAGRIAWIA